MLCYAAKTLVQLKYWHFWVVIAIGLCWLVMRHTHTWTISGPGLSVSVNSITIIMEVVYLEFTQNEYHHHHQDHHHGSHNQQPECGYGVSRPQDDLCIYIWISVMITTQIVEAVLTGWLSVLFAKVCFAQCSTSRLALGSPGCCRCRHHAQNSIYANIYRFWALVPVYIMFTRPDQTIIPKI